MQFEDAHEVVELCRELEDCISDVTVLVEDQLIVLSGFIPDAPTTARQIRAVARRWFVYQIQGPVCVCMTEDLHWPS